MNARLASWSQPASPLRAVVAAALAMIVFGAAWGLLHRGFYTHSEIVDTPVYQNYGDAMVDGNVPYRDFGLEYPPAALPVFAVPSLLRSPEGDIGAYRDGFELVMALCGELAVLFVLSALLSLEAGPGRLTLGLGFAAVGAVTARLRRADALRPLAGGADRRRAGGVPGRPRTNRRRGARPRGRGEALSLCARATRRGLGLAARGRRAARWPRGAVFLAVLLACFLPFLVLAPHGVWDSVTRQTGRPLQIESLGAGVLLALHQAVGLGITMESSHGSQNLAGSGADALAALLAGLQLLAIVGVWVWFARGPADSDRLTRAFAAAVCAFIAFGKVLSPQFLIWLVPLVVLVRGRRGLAAGATFALALVLTQLWFPFRYWPLVLHFAAFPSWMVLLRDLTLVALFAVLLILGDRDSQRFDRGSAAVRVALDHDPLEPDAALRRAEAHRHSRPHPPDREVGLDADHRVVRARHPGVGDRRRAAGLDPRVARLDVRMRPDHRRHAAVEVVARPRPSRSSLPRGSRRPPPSPLRAPPRRGRPAPRKGHGGRRGRASPAR